MSRRLEDRIEASTRIALHLQSELTALRGERHLTHVQWADRRTGAVRHIPWPMCS
jgi:thioredoxin reductase (NADPH)